MQSINDIIFAISGVSLDSTESSELSLAKTKEEENGIFFAVKSASVINMVCNTVASLDYLVDFAILNNLSITDINNKGKKVLYLKNKISDYSVLDKIASQRMNFITELPISGSVAEGGYLLQENSKYILQENTFKIRL
jgi:hypothetical protein